jgi:hypothetical protein
MGYYKTSAEYQLLRLLDLADVHSCSAIALKKHPNAFGLVSPVRTYYLRAESAGEALGWIEAIEGARQAMLATSSSRSKLLKSLARNPAAATSSHDENAAVETPTSPTRACFSSSDSEDVQGAEIVPTASPSREPTGCALREPQKILLSGYLMKCGSKRRNWRKRWFMLSSEKLAYSASHMVGLIASFLRTMQIADINIPSDRIPKRTANFPSLKSWTRWNTTYLRKAIYLRRTSRRHNHSHPVLQTTARMHSGATHSRL